jgi:hypothetical protein
MRTLSNADLLLLWERGRALHPLDQGILAIHTASPDSTGEAIADWPLGLRNRALIRLRALHFGPHLEGWVQCESCGDKLEFHLDATAMIAQSAPPSDDLVSLEGQSFRLPTSRDLARVLDHPDRALHLLELCRTSPPAEAPDTEALGVLLAEADPLAEILIDCACPLCGAPNRESLDLSSFLWQELESRARRTLFEVHTLAAAYGWSEQQVLDLSEVRRQTYLAMVQA